MPAKTIRASVERIEKSNVVLSIGGREVAWPRTQLPAALSSGDELVFEIRREATSEAERDAEAEQVDAKARRVGGHRKRGSPRTASLRTRSK